MCGISGILLRDARLHVGRDQIQRMNDAQIHRGPDADGIWTHGPLGLGHRRLSIIDISDAGRQPMGNEDGTIWIVFNGEIYNYRELRAELQQPHQFRSNSDTEVLLHLYEERGIDLVQDLDGMFAFCIVDLKQQMAFLARDHFGIKPLHYTLSENGLYFASELKAILAASGSTRQIDKQALNDFFEYQWIPAPQTIYQDIRKLPPANWLSLNWSTWQVRQHRYWRATYAPMSGRSIGEWEDEVAHELEASVRRQLVADVELGSFLSGGIDSTLVTTFAAGQRGRQLKTFTIDFAEAGNSEGDKAREVAQQLQVNSIFETLPNTTIGELEALSNFYDEPFADSSLLPTTAVSRVARKHVTVALSGDGGDELFTGYTHHDLADRLSRLDRIPSGLLAFGFGVGRKLMPKNSRAYEWCQRLALSPQDRRLTLLRLPCRGQRRTLLTPALRETCQQRWEAFRSLTTGLDDLPPITQVQLWDLEYYLPNDMLVKVDRASMSVSLEVRVPMLCPRLANLAFRMPEEVRFRPPSSKPILRGLVAKHYGPNIAQAPKRGFAIPRQAWMKQAASPQLERDILEGAAIRDGILHPQGVRQLFSDVRRPAGKWYTERSDELFGLLVFHHWWRRFQGNPTS